MGMVVLLAVWAMGLAGCQAARAGFLRSEVGTVVPRGPDGEAVQVEVDAKYTNASLAVTLTCAKPPGEVVAYYQRELAARGFVLNGDAHGDALPGADDASPAASKGGEQSRMYEFTRGNDVLWKDFLHLAISWREAGGPCKVYVLLRHGSYVGEFAKAPVALPACVVFLPLLPTGEGYAGNVYYVTYWIVDLLY